MTLVKEQGLGEKGLRFLEVMERLRAWVFTHDPDGRITYVSPAFKELMGYSPEEPLDLQHAIAPEFLQEALRRTEAQIRGEEIEQPWKLQVLHKGGQRRWIEIQTAALHDSDGRLVQVVGLARDIQQEKALEEQLRTQGRELEKLVEARTRALRESQERYRLVTENTSDLIALATFSEDPVYTYVSPSHRALGVEPHELVGKPCLSVVHPEDRANLREALSRYLTLRGQDTESLPRGPLAFERIAFRVLNHQGEWRHMESTVNLANPETLLFVSKDVTERIRMEEALRESEEIYRRTLETAPESITITRVEDGRYMEVNDAFTKLSGYTREEALGRTPADLGLFVNPEDRNRFVEILRRDGFVDDFEVTFRRKNGALLHSLLSARPIRFRGEDCLVAMVRDVTARKAAQKTREELEARLIQAQKMEAIGTLAGGIAHDFNNILGAILGYAEMISLFDLPEDSPVRAKVNQILKAGNRAKDLVSQILTFCRQAEKETRPLTLAPIVKETLKFLRATIPSSIEIRQRVSAGDAVVLGDPTQFQQVVMNLCTNAAHAMEEHGGVLEVRLEEVDPASPELDALEELAGRTCVRLSVSDTGPGMDRQTLDRIFEPYFTTKGPGKGTGMGLAMVHGIVQSHGGAIRTLSEPGKGTTFHVYFPLVEEEKEEPAEITAPLPGGTERILFVDDEEFLVALGKGMLERLGYRVWTRTSPLEALEAFGANPGNFDLVITDLTMPRMTGDVLALKLREIRPDIPVILCTGFGHVLEERGGPPREIDEVLLKPLLLRDLAQAVRGVLDRKAEQAKSP